ncbi:MAG: hypothetical protein HKN21_04725 [Candidatus Eisenbacteria bacterium]|uniref:Flagellar biosynthesis protein FlhF n=1 Tax=Eiseniibacteriota bacterium TaxID=2212470 RepID=A0A7Y2E7W7_UNCEI|nr:hypothetical protein [Candidatus Eisenbacteria bacterium]
MSREIFTGTKMNELFLQVQDALGPDAVLLSVRRTPESGELEVVATDSITAENLLSEPEVLPISSETPAVASAKPYVVALVGPTGSGKTTTLAKLANHKQAYGHRRVGFLSLDTYRVGAVDQLRAFADLSQVPLEVAYEVGDCAQSLQSLADQSVILVDTPGRGPRERQDSEVIQAMLTELNPDEVHLTLPANTDREHMESLLAELGPRVSHVLPTKLDESPTNTQVFEVAAAFHRPVKWMAVGQRVPLDLREVRKNQRAFAEDIASMAVGF